MNNEFYSWLDSDVRVDEYNEEELHNKAVNFASNTVKKRNIMFDKKKEKVYYFRRCADGALIPVEESLVPEMKMRMKNGYREFDFIGEIKEEDKTPYRGEEAPVISFNPEIIETKIEDNGKVYKKRGRKPANLS
jgi:hypothetical protein